MTLADFRTTYYVNRTHFTREGVMRSASEIAREHECADARVGGCCGCAACCIERWGMTPVQHARYRRTRKWPKNLPKPTALMPDPVKVTP